MTDELVREEPEQALRRILTMFGMGCTISGGIALGHIGNPQANPASCEECLDGAVAAIMEQVVAPSLASETPGARTGEEP